MQDGIGLQPTKGKPVLPTGQIQEAECRTGWHIADSGHGLDDERHGLRHWPLWHSSASGQSLEPEHPTVRHFRCNPEKCVIFEFNGSVNRLKIPSMFVSYQ